MGERVILRAVERRIASLRAVPSDRASEHTLALRDAPAMAAELRELRLERDQLSRDASDARRQLGVVRASVVRLDDERRILRDLLGDLTAKATPHGPEIDEPGGPYVGAYLLPIGPVHRALAYLRDGAIPSVRTGAMGERPCRPCQDADHDRCLGPVLTELSWGCCCDDLDRGGDGDG